MNKLQNAIYEVSLVSAMNNYKFKNENTIPVSRGDIVIAIIDDWPLAGIVGKVIDAEFMSGYLTYKLKIIHSIGSVSTHQVNDFEYIYVSPFEICEKL